jgi:hypothetical protein
MLLYVCKECGIWVDMEIDRVMKQMLSAVRVARGEEPIGELVYPCPEGHGPMQCVLSGYRLFAWNPEECDVTSERIAATLSERSEGVHDGDLDGYDHDDDSHATVEMMSYTEEGHDQTRVCIDGCDLGSSVVYLDPEQALSLLTWLQQQKSTLERLVARDGETKE